MAPAFAGIFVGVQACVFDSSHTIEHLPFFFHIFSGRLTGEAQGVGIALAHGGIITLEQYIFTSFISIYIIIISESEEDCDSMTIVASFDVDELSVVLGNDGVSWYRTIFVAFL